MSLFISLITALVISNAIVVVALPQIDPGLGGEEDATYSVEFVQPGRRNTATKENQAGIVVILRKRTIWIGPCIATAARSVLSNS